MGVEGGVRRRRRREFKHLYQLQVPEPINLLFWGLSAQAPQVFSFLRPPTRKTDMPKVICDATQGSSSVTRGVAVCDKGCLRSTSPMTNPLQNAQQTCGTVASLGEAVGIIRAGK